MIAMKSFLSLLFATTIFCLSSCAQHEPNLLDKAKQKLDDNAGNVSVVLTDPAFLGIHQETSFREMIRAHASARPLSIAPDKEPGRKIKVKLRLTDAEGKPIANASIYLYQTDSKGWYAADKPHVGGNEGDSRHARLFGYVLTDDKGEMELHTVKPSGYPQSDLPAHIHIHFEAKGFRTYVTELLFDDDPRLIGEIRRQSEENRFYISKPEASTVPFEQQFSYVIQLTRN